MAGTAFTKVLLLASVAGLLGACQGDNAPFAKADKPPQSAADAETGAQATPGKPPAPQNARSVKLVDRDVEAPDVFSVSDMALWDGRPSLGGVWVASPEAVDPERVILRNASNGKFVIGALFRRERDNPGPTLQISSDAAAALGLLAGQPGKISVTALRREEAPIAAPDATKPILDVAETVESETLDPIAGAEAAIAAAESNGAAKPKGGGLFRKKQPATGGPAAPIITSGVATTALAGAPAAAQPAQPAAAGNPEQKPVAAASGGGIIQIGIFSVEANAKRAVDTLTKAGVAASVRAEKAQGKDFWSVTAAGGAEGLAKVKAAGFSDAYMLKRG